MEIFNSVYHNFFTVCSLIPAVFNLTLAIIFYLIPNKSKATFHIMMMYFLMFLFFLAYFFAAVFYHPLAAYHRWITVGVVVLAIIHFIIFLYNFPDERNPRLAKTLLIVYYTIAFSFTFTFMFISYNSSKVFHFAGHYWDFNADHFSKIYSYVIILFMFICLFTGIWRTIVTKTKERWTVLTMVIFLFIAVMIPGVTNTLSRDGALDRGTFQITQDLSTIIGFFVLTVFYINATKDRSNFMTKILGISFATLLIVFQALSYFSLQDMDKAYDSLAKKDITILLNYGEKSDHLEYMVKFTPNDYSFNFSYMRNKKVSGLNMFGERISFYNTLLYENIAALKPDKFKEKLAQLLIKAPVESGGFVSLIKAGADKLNGTEKNPGRIVLKEVDDVKSKVKVSWNKIRKLPNHNFRAAVEKFLSKKNKRIKDFYTIALNDVKTSQLSGERLKTRVIEFFSPMHGTGTRIYRKDTKDKNHYIVYMHVDLEKQVVYEGGFNYISYREYLHPTSMKLILMLGGIMVVIFVGFQFFFHGAFIVPIKSLLAAMYKVKNGDLNVSVDIKVEDELGHITRNFNNMIDTIRGARQKLDDYAQNLEHKVDERTEELNAAMEEMAAINEQLVETRDALWGEMELAQKIQTVLLPEKLEVSGYEISAFMKPADEVGGDYYDVIHEGGRDWIVIGDVSGHGVPAGLVMMMVQTSIHSVLSSNPNIAPMELLTLVNKTITFNMKRLGEDKYMTITVLLRENDSFHFSGLHQDIMVYRKALNKVELIETSGIWIGIIDDIGDMLTSDSLDMQVGDVMLLYTDGITEAWDMSVEEDKRMSDDMFGDKKLLAILEKHGSNSTEEIQRTILNEVETNYQTSDDITMVVLKRLK